MFDRPDVQDNSQESGNSWVSNLSNAAGWLNPFKLVRSGANKTMAIGAVILNSIGSVSALDVGSICFDSPNSLGNSYRIYCINGQTSNLYEMIQSACKVTLDSCSYMGGPRNWLQSFGSGTFGGAMCKLYGVRSHKIDDYACIVDVLNKNVVNGYGTFQDVGATIGIIVGGGAVLAGLSYAGFRLFKRNEEASTVVVPDENTLLVSGVSSDDIALKINM